MVNSFLIYDLTFLVLFTLLTIFFLYTHKKNLKREGLLYLYRTSFGIKFIEKFTKRFSKILKPMQYLVLLSGYTLMIGMIYMLIKFSWIYLTSPIAARVLKVPVLIPLVPYLPDIFKIDFLPSFNFTYWIIIIALIAIPHEFAHGIFARLNKIKIHSTGFGFLGPFLAAFVEQDEKDMEKSSKFAQLSVLAAGTFANILTLLVFFIIFWAFFAAAFTPAGVNFTSYSTTIVNSSSIDIPENFSLDDDFVSVNSKFSEEVYYTNPIILQQSINQELPYLIVYENTPAFNSKLKGAISSINGEKITSYDSLTTELDKYSPSDTVKIKTLYQKSVRENNIQELEYEIVLAENPNNLGKAFLGIGISSSAQQSGIIGSIFTLISKIKDPLLFYQSNLGTFGWFIYFFLWWSLVILISVALVNMLPVGIFDGGRFFFLTVWAITGSKKIGENAFKASTWIILLLVAAMMVKWVMLFL